MERSHAKAGFLASSSQGDVVFAGNLVNITGLNSMRVDDITDIQIKKARAEIAQVVTIGGTTDPTIAYDTTYAVGIKRILNKSRSSNYDGKYTKYTATLAASAGSAALDRQAIYDSLTSKINADPSNSVVAAAGAGGTAMTITDDGSYFSGLHNALFGGDGVAAIKLFPHSDGTGFVDSTHLEISTAHVYASGIGVDLQKYGAGHGVYGHLVSEAVEMKDATNAAVTDQLYTFFGFQSLVDVNYHTGASAGAWKFIYQEIWVDDGTGTTTTNLSGHAAFMREIEKVLYKHVLAGPNTLYFGFENQPSASNAMPLGAPLGDPTPLVTDAAVTNLRFDEGTLRQINITQQDLMVPAVIAAGMNVSGDATDGDGFGWNPSWFGTASRFVVGSGVHSARFTALITDSTDIDPFLFGWRVAIAEDNDYTNYTDYCLVGQNTATGAAGDIEIIADNAAAAQEVTDVTGGTGQDWADGETHTFEVRIEINGEQTVFMDDVDITSNITTQRAFAADVVIIPYVVAIHNANDPGASISSLAAYTGVIERNK